jgi:hypothetical protein
MKIDLILNYSLKMWTKFIRLNTVQQLSLTNTLINEGVLCDCATDCKFL